MTALPHKLTFQLTPLLDLLLIVIFAQYMEVRHQAEAATAGAEAGRKAAERRLQQAVQSLSALHTASDAQRARLAELEQQKQSLQEGIDKLRQNAARLEQRNIELEESLKQARQQRDTVGRLLTELFRIPEGVLEEQLEPAAAGAPSRLPEEIAALKEKFRALAQQRPHEAVKHLLTYEELRKRCDIWEIYIAENGMMRFTAGGRAFRFRAETAGQFATQVYDFYKTLPQPKSLVIILLSYGNAKALWRKAARDGLREAAARMRADRSGQTSFEYAVLGYRPEVDSERRDEQ